MSDLGQEALKAEAALANVLSLAALWDDEERTLRAAKKLCEQIAERDRR